MRGWAARVGLRKPVWDEPSWTRTFLPLMPWEERLLNEAMNAPIDHDVINGRRSLCEMNGCYERGVHRGFDGLDWCERHKAYAVTDPDDYDQIPDDPAPLVGVRYRPAKGALLGPGSGIETPEQADRIVGALRGRPLEAATHLLDDCPCPRPCCHTTGPHHHPACQEAQ